MNSPILLVLLAGAYVVDACSSSRRAPPPPPPPEAPPAPKAPPPIVKVVRTQEQNVGFNKCYRICTGQNTEIDPSTMQPIGSSSAFGVSCTATTPITSNYGSGPQTETTGAGTTYTTPNGQPCAMSTDCKYECKFTVFTEVALRVISKPADCGCAFHISIVKPRPARVVANTLYANVAQDVTVGDFSLVVWDIKANRVVEKIPGFTLDRNENTKAAIAAQIKAGSTEDFTAVTAGFSGEVTRFENLPDSLNLNLEENLNHVPALSFEVTQTYTDSKTWDPPQAPDLGKMPNAWQSQCVPYWPEKPFCYNDKKRQVNQACGSAPNTVFMKKFFLFPKKLQSESSGQTIAARQITSFYTTADCRVANGIFSVDSEFTQTLDVASANMAIGTWGWKRVFQDADKFGTRYYLGVPAVFSSISEVWSTGYSSIKWYLPAGYNVENAHPAVKKICSSFAPTRTASKYDKYDNNLFSFAAEAGIKCAPIDDVTASTQCGSVGAPDRSIMAFINEGQILNFNKNEDSILVVGKQSAGCQSQPQTEPVFDVLQFHGVVAGQEPLTRAEKRELHDDYHSLGLVYDEEANGFRHFLHPGAHDMLLSQRRKRGVDALDALTSAVATPPNENDFDMRVATGTVDGNGGIAANGGDHPIELFPETFSAPVNIDPKANASVVVDASATTGTMPPACNKGSIGCSCRVTGADACDLGLLCASNNKCMLKDCKPGDSGCPCVNNGCNGEGLECKGSVCALKSTCAMGTAGCECAAGSSCSDASKCTDGLCIMAGSCATGSPGCVCSSTPLEFGGAAAVPGELYCNKGLTCDRFMGSCLAPRCASGAPGCRCKGDQTCESGFQCDTKKNVCSAFACPVGDPGCQCLASGKCNKVGFRCEAFTSTGDRRCIADGDSCAPDGKTAVQRCTDFCGAGNVLRCPPCANGRPYCKSIGDKEKKEQCELPENAQRPFCSTLCLRDPFNAACQDTGSASSLVIAAAAALVAALALLF